MGLQPTGLTGGDVARPAMGTAVVVERRRAGRRGGLFAAERAEFGQADQQSQRGALGDAGDAAEQLEAGLEIAVTLYGGQQAVQFGLAAALQAGGSRSVAQAAISAASIWWFLARRRCSTTPRS